MPNIAMRRPGTQFSGDGIDLSWPLGGEREVVSVPDDMPLRVRRRIAEGQIVITSDPATPRAEADARVYRLLTGDEARAHMAIPAGPVTRVVYQPSVPESERGYQMVVQEAHESDRHEQARREAAERAVAEQDAIVQRQVEAEREAAQAPAPEPPEPDSVQERLNRHLADASDYLAQREAEFMQREKARQVEAGEVAVKEDTEVPSEVPASDGGNENTETKSEDAKPVPEVVPEPAKVAPEKAPPKPKAAPVKKPTAAVKTPPKTPKAKP